MEPKDASYVTGTGPGFAVCSQSLTFNCDLLVHLLFRYGRLSSETGPSFSSVAGEPRYFVGANEDTRLHMLSARERDLGYIDALYDLDWDEEREILRESLARQHDFKFLDKVLADFLRTNKHEGQLWSLEELLQIDSPHPGKEFGYLNRNILWASTVWRREGLPKQTKCNLASYSHLFLGSSEPSQFACREGRETDLLETA